MTPRLLGLFLVLGANLCFSLGGLWTRLAAVDAWTNTFWRSLFMALTILAFLMARDGRASLGRIRAIGWAGVLSGLLLSLCFIGYLMSLQHTLVARAVVFMSLGPLFAALFGRLVLGERLSPVTVAAFAVAGGGVAMMVGEGFVPGGGFAGDLFALLVAVAFAANIVVLRRAAHVDMLPAALVAGAISMAACLPFADLSPPAGAMGWLVLLGTVQLAGGLLLFLAGAPKLTAAETGMLSLTEAVLAVIWVAAFLGELPSAATLIGGAVVIAGVAINAAGTGWRRTSPRAAAA
ncbi:MAG: hypothetical protein OHK0024_04650 [Thalassobaculales bacterium]